MKETIPSNVICASVRELRHRLKDSQQKFSHRLGITLPTVQRWETTRAPKGLNLKLLASVARRGGSGIYANYFEQLFEEEADTFIREHIGA